MINANEAQGLGAFPARRVRVRGVDYAITDSDGSGAPVLLLHGWPDDRTIWRHQVTYLHAAGYRAIALMEAALPPLFPIDFANLEELGPIGQIWSLLITPDVSQEAILNQNMFIETMLPQMVVNPLDEATLDAYRAPFPDPASRTPILGSSPGALHLYDLSEEEFNADFATYIDWLDETEVPVLLLSFAPGALVGEESVAWAEETIDNLTHVALGAGAHFVQEDQPDAIGEAIALWYEQAFTCSDDAQMQQ